MIEIQVNNLVKSFEVGHNVLDGVTFQIDQGQRVGLLGKNGAGKSTLIKVMTGFHQADEGAMLIGGQPVVFSNAFSGIWWAVSTLLTVGYGDITPSPPLARSSAF